MPTDNLRAEALRVARKRLGIDVGGGIYMIHPIDIEEFYRAAYVAGLKDALAKIQYPPATFATGIPAIEQAIKEIESGH
jgi:hypothetical protein